MISMWPVPLLHMFVLLLSFLIVPILSFTSVLPTEKLVSPPTEPSHLQLSAAQNDQVIDPNWDLRIAIVGAGPSGLLLAHRLTESKLPINKLDIYESRSDPRDTQKLKASRAYALGLGIRGRTAIKTVDNELWNTIKQVGFECERFRLHLSSKINIKLRDREEGVEPSLLIYQSDLCGSLLNELERRADGDILNINFCSKITKVDLEASTISTNEDKAVSYDLIVGCDGANSIIRNAMQEYSPPFSFTQRKLLPGCFKVARTEKRPPLIDPESVALILPQTKSLGITAFVEPTVGGSSCILFAGRLPSADNETESLSEEVDEEEKEMNLNSILFPPPDFNIDDISKHDTGTITNLIIEQFPQLEGTPGIDDVVEQLLSQRTAVASSVKCNTYNSNKDVIPTAIIGDAAHATGGVSGQGCNSALMDAVRLADSIEKHYQPAKEFVHNFPNTKKEMLYQSVSAYSQKAVPEGHALYDLSFGNDGKTLPIFRNIRALISNGIDAVFGGKLGIGKKPLQTLLASSSDPFVDIRRDREKYFLNEFPTDEDFRKQLSELYSTR